MYSFMEEPDQREYQNAISTVIPGKLYISGFMPANDATTLRDLEIRHVVRLGDAHDLLLYETHENVLYHTVELEDCLRAHMTIDLLEAAVKFIREATTPVLVHCYAGVSRSASIVIAYLVSEQGLGVRQARLQVKECRPCISPNDTFLKNLVAYQMHKQKIKAASQPP